MVFNRFRFTSLIVLLLVLLAGCGGGETAGGETADNTGSDTETSAAPAETKADRVADRGEEMIIASAEANRPLPTPTIDPNSPTSYEDEEGVTPTLTANVDDLLIPTTEAGFAFSTDTTLPPFNPADFGGDIVASGSSAILPLAEAVAGRFQDDGFSGAINIDNIGSTLDPLCGGQADIANYVTQIISRSDLDTCAPEGAEGIDFVVGRDVLVMVIHPANDFATKMTRAELILALTTAETWADVNPAWPDWPIQRFYPVISYHGVAGFLGTDPQLMENADNLIRSENDQTLVDGVAQNEGAIGFFTYGVYRNNQASVTAVRLDGYAPEESDYLFSLPLHMVTFDTIMQDKPQVAAYLGYVLVYGPETALELGFAPPDAETRQENEALWLEIMGGG